VGNCYHRLLAIDLKCLGWRVSTLQLFLAKISSKWTDFNLFNMNAWKQNLKRSMIKELISYTRELRWDRLSRAHIKTLIWFWCRIIYKILELWLRGTLIEEVVANISQPTFQQHFQVMVWLYLEWIQNKAKIEDFKQIQTPIQKQILVIDKVCLEVVQESLVKMENNILLSVNSIINSI